MSVDASQLEHRVRSYARDRVERIGNVFVDHLRGHMPRRSGDMAASAEVDSIIESGSGVTVRIVVGSPYARFQNEGTGIYGPNGTPIYPLRPGGVLVFDWPAAGGVVFFRHVAGTEPTHFWQRTLDEWPQILAESA